MHLRGHRKAGNPHILGRGKQEDLRLFAESSVSLLVKKQEKEETQCFNIVHLQIYKNDSSSCNENRRNMTLEECAGKLMDILLASRHYFSF